MPAAVHVVLCIDTEGPVVDPGRPELLATWDAVDVAMDKLFEPSFRARFPDPGGGGLRIGWFFLTWTGFTSNPRGRAFGYHAVRDHYLARWGPRMNELGDEQCWHYHQPPASGVGNEWGLDWEASREYEQILSRQVLEREWWPACFRAGGTIMDARSSRWVDAWFPVDYTNRAPAGVPGIVDWSTGVAEWSLYHPDVEDFRRPGAGRRRMARCLDLVTDLGALSEQDVEEAFRRAAGGLPAVLAAFDHDYRDIAPRVDGLRELVHEVARRHPDVPWRYAAPAEAVRGYLDLPPPRRLELDASFHGGAVHVRSSAPLFQAIPWLAVRRSDGTVEHVEADALRLEPTRWRWTVPDGLDWRACGIGGSTDDGASAAVAITPDDGPGGLFLRTPTRRSPAHPRSVWDHSKYYVELCIARACGAVEETDAARQAAEWLAPRLAPGMSVLDVGCAAGHLERSLRVHGVEYHGIDPAARAIEIGRRFGDERGLAAWQLRELPVEELPVEERYDAVVCLSTLLYMPMFHLPLEAMARAARRWLVVRSSFGERTEVRYLPDVLLEPGFQALRTHFNVFGRDEVAAFLAEEGFAVTWAEDLRQSKRFGGEPEVVGGVAIPYEFLFAERVSPSPDDAALLGEELGAVAQEWLDARRDG
jgi:SAM-dependent methyltransferase